MISKEKFVEAINKIKEVKEFHNDINNVCRKYSVDYYCFDMDCQLIDVVINVLEESLEVDGELICWWIYDCDFGEDADMLVNDEKVDLSTSELFYDFLVDYKEDIGA